MMEYNFRDIEKRWQQHWSATGIYQASNNSSRPKCYVLDMFPYPSGAGLHVGHPLGYIASDIYSRYKRLKGFNVLHPMGYDAFGLPAEQYAIDHGIHPAISTENNINNFRRQLDNIGFSFDWSREVRTSDPSFYKWTQWIFLQLYKSFYNRQTKKAEPIENLVAVFEKEGNVNHPVPNSFFQQPNSDPGFPVSVFSAKDWSSFDERTRQDILMEYRLAYCGYGEVNWCEALGTVLANDEVINGVSERGGFPVEKKKLRQWYLRITEYADRLLEGLQQVDFSEAMKEMQSNWIGKSEGAEISFGLQTPAHELNNSQLKAQSSQLNVYTTRPDTIFGVDFMVLAPEHEMVEWITTASHKQEVENYLAYVKSRTERERMAERKISGAFTGAYVLHPFTQKPIPVWISEYVLIGYGTGAIMAVPCGDERDHKFAKHFNIPITNIIGAHYNGGEANPTKDAVLENSGFLDGILMKDAIEIAIKKLEENGFGKRKVNYKMRDAAFSRQRYWGEPIPISWNNGIAYPLEESQLPLVLPHMEEIKPGKDGDGPLSNNEAWLTSSIFGGGRGEASTMPGYAGSSWYFLRYMDPDNENWFCDRKCSDYWGQVDLYIGGTEHAVGHLLYSRMWTKFLFDRGWIGFDEPYKKLVNQGMIQGSSRFVYRVQPRSEIPFEGGIPYNKQIFISSNILKEVLGDFEDDDEINDPGKQKNLFSIVKDGVKDFPELKTFGPLAFLSIQKLHVDVNIVDGVELNIEAFRSWRNGEYEDAILICDNGSVSSPLEGGPAGAYICGTEIEKMSKSKFNTVNPNDIVERFGADTFRMYEMFLGPVEMSKPWDTKGIEGVHRFLRKFWRLFFHEEKGLIISNEPASDNEKKILHKTIKKIEEDTERFSFNTAVSAFMIATNELQDINCHKRTILEPLLILLAPYAPHITEELWHRLGNSGSVLDASFPVFEEKYIRETAKTYPVAINGKTRTELIISLDATQQQVEEIVLANDIVRKWLEGKLPKKVIYVKNKMVNVVV